MKYNDNKIKIYCIFKQKSWMYLQIFTYISLPIPLNNYERYIVQNILPKQFSICSRKTKYTQLHLKMRKLNRNMTCIMGQIHMVWFFFFYRYSIILYNNNYFLEISFIKEHIYKKNPNLRNYECNRNISKRTKMIYSMDIKYKNNVYTENKHKLTFIWFNKDHHLFIWRNLVH